MFLVFVAIALAAVILWGKLDGWDNIAPGILALTLGITLLFAALGVPLNQLEIRAKLAEFKAVSTTVATARERDADFENATLQLQIIEANQWLARAKYWRGTFLFSIYYPGVIDNAEPIR